MSAKPSAGGVRRPPAVALSGHASVPTGRPIRLATTATPAKPKRSTRDSSLSTSAKKASTPSRSSPAPKRTAGSVGSTATRGKTPTKTGGAAAASAAGGRGSSVASHGSHNSAAPAPRQPAAAALASQPQSHPVILGGSSAGAADALAAAPPSMTSFARLADNERQAHGAGEEYSPAPASLAASASPAVSYAPTTATTTHRSRQAPSTVGTALVAAATSAVTGERYEPTEYRAGFSLEGDYTCIAAVPQSAALWMGNKVNGGLDIYSSTTGKLTVSLPPRSQVERARARERARLRGMGRSNGTRGGAVDANDGHRDRIQEMIFPSTSPAGTPTPPPPSLGGSQTDADVVRPTALCPTRTHMWVGYENGTVAVYDHLVLTFITEGTFHRQPVIQFATLDDGTVVSASEDGTLVHWDTEEKNFEAIAVLPSAGERGRSAHHGSGSVGSQDGELCALIALPKSSVVLCGFHSGSIYAVDVVAAVKQLHRSESERQQPTLLSLHHGRINGLAVLGDILFTASEDGSVCCVRLQFSVAGADAKNGAVVVRYGVAPPQGAAALAQTQRHLSWRLLKRVHTTPAVRDLLTDKNTLSLYVAYADGLLERWSGNPDDDFGVEEVIREGMKIACETVQDEDDDNAARRPGKKSAGAAALLSGHPACSGGSNREVTGLIAINAVETWQVLALSSNGANKVWYGHRNLLEENISTSINALNAVICEDTHDTAVWRERMSLLKVKENERKAKYVLILEQLSEQRLLLKFYEKWRRRVIHSSAGKAKETIAAALAERTDYRLAARFFGTWALFYDVQQKRFRRHALCHALAEATQRVLLVSVLHRWQTSLVLRKVRVSSEKCADVLARVSAALLMAPAFHTWVRFSKRKVERRDGVATLQQQQGLSESQLAQMERKAQEQTLRRALAHWLDAADQKQQREQRLASWNQYMDVYARLQDAKKAKSILQGWRRWAGRRSTHAALSAVAELRAQQCHLHLQQSAFLRWSRFLHARHLETHVAEMGEVEAKLRKAESDSGGDIFEKLQLQKRIDQLIQQQETEERLLRQDQSRLRALQHDRDSLLQQREQEHLQQAEGRQSDGSYLVPISHNTMAALPATNASVGAPPTPSSAATTGKGPMASHASFFWHLIEQQRLSHAVLAQMPLTEAIYHVLSQLKGNILNMYTDMALFRQVKDRRRAGATAAAIFLESFCEVKRLIVTSVRRNALKAGGRAARWPILLETLDCIPTHHCASVLNAIKTMVVAFDLISPEDSSGIAGTLEEVVANADWIFLIARACHMRRKPQLPVSNRV